MNQGKSMMFVVVAILALGTTCKKATVPPASMNHESQTAHDEHEDHSDSKNAKKPSDLDRPITDLIALSCEHGTKTFVCDECRYEVGFVRAPAKLFQDGLFKTIAVEKQKIAIPTTLTGEIRFDERRVGHVGSQVEGIVKQVYVALGDQVRKGQPLIEIESVTIGEAQTDYLQNQELLKLARRNFNRVSELHHENIASEKEFLHAKQEIDAAEIRAKGAQGKLSRLGAAFGNRGRLVLRAPIDGQVLVMHAVPGEVVKNDQPLLTVGNNTTVWVWADLYERDIAAVKAGQATQKIAASVSVKAYPNEQFTGTVDRISPAMDESSRTVKVRLEVGNADGRLLSGMFATVTLYLPGDEEAITVPREAVLEDEGRSFVFVHHQGDDYVRRPVTIGRAWAGWVEVKQGIKVGQVVVTQGAFLLKSDVLRSKMGAGCAD